MTIDMKTWKQRKAVGDAHEDRVAPELERRGWTVHFTGQRTWPEAISLALRGTDTVKRFEEDMIVARGSTVRLIDCKGTTYGDDALTYRISRKTLQAHSLYTAVVRLPIYYVFHNLGVMTLTDVLRACRLDSPADITGGYVTIDVDAPKPFDAAFGSPLMYEVEQLVRGLPQAMPDAA